MVKLILLYAVGVTLVTISLYINYKIGRRKFYRRNAVGVEGFSSYNRALFIPYIESWLSVIGLFMRALGFIILIGTYADRREIAGNQPQASDTVNKNKPVTPGGKPFLRKSLHGEKRRSPMQEK